MRRILWIAPLFVSGLFVGCGTDEDKIALVPVAGTVTKNGKPMAGASVSFVPDQANAFSTPGIDAAGPEGTFKIRFKNRSGLAPGKYKVFVTPELTTGSDTPEAFKDDPYMASLAKGPGATKKTAGEKSEFDAEIGEKGETDLAFDVKASSSSKK